MNTVMDEVIVSDAGKQALKVAQAIGKENMHGYFGAPHLLKALLHKETDLEEKLWQLDYDVYYLNDWVDARLESYTKAAAPKEQLHGDSHIPLILEEADSIRNLLGATAVEPAHLLLAITTPGVAYSHDQLKTFPLQRDRLMQELQGDVEIKSMVSGKHGSPSSTTTEKNQQALLRFCQDKTLQASAGKTDPIVGREKETRMMAEILSRRSKPNVLIVGEPGVGKTALVDGFALAIVQQQVPQFLQSAKIYELDNGALVAGASYKGEVEERLKSILTEIKAQDKAILFIDEIHTLLDKQGAAAGAANLLKPELARGAITVIGATTAEEYRKHIEKDQAFSRRFEVLMLDEPDADTAFKMMQGVIEHYEEHHRITTDADTLKEAVRLAKRYIKDKKLPDSAIDLADRSMAALRLAIDTGKQTADNLEQQYNTLKENTGAALEEWHWHYRQLQHAISPVLWTEVAPEEDLLKIQDLFVFQANVGSVYQRLQSLLPFTRTTLQVNDIASVVAARTGIPVGKLQSQEKEKLVNMPVLLRQRVVGQDYAIAAISEAILESRSGLSKPGQPIGSFFFLGPTGTGKTELAKALAELLFQDERFMIRFDMSEFKEEHAAALLYGAPPGYVGYEEGGLLVNKIRQQPYSVVLFDEIEKAHASVFDIFLQIMDEGKLHDKLGKEGDFSNAVVIFTSNIASQYITSVFANGKAPTHTELLDCMSDYFRPEFLGRLTEIVPFGPMNLAMVENIFKIQVRSLYDLLNKQGITLSITPAAAQWLATMGFTPEYGARPLAAVIRGQLRRPLARKIISGELLAGDEVVLDVKDGEANWEVQSRNGKKM
jgi:ATP-dependent Clp protease ATP-binding subunit ClpB